MRLTIVRVFGARACLAFLNHVDIRRHGAPITADMVIENAERIRRRARELTERYPQYSDLVGPTGWCVVTEIGFGHTHSTASLIPIFCARGSTGAGE